MGGDIPMGFTETFFEVWKRNVAITHNLKDHRTIRALVSRTSEKYVLQSDGTLKQICNMTHLVNQNFEGVERGADWSMTFKRIAPFKDNAPPEMEVSLYRYLKAQGMDDRIPKADSSSNLPPVRCLFAK